MVLCNPGIMQVGKKNLLAGLFLLLTCNVTDDLFKNPQINPVKRVLSRTMPIGYAANLAIAAMNGNKLTNVTILRGNPSGGGSFLLAISVDTTFPLPSNVFASGRILVNGITDDLRHGALISIIFTELNIKHGNIHVQDISNVLVSYKEDAISNEMITEIMYTEFDVNSGSDTLINVDITREMFGVQFNRYQNMKQDSLNVENKLYFIRAFNSNTPEDPTDDRYLVSGTGAYSEVVSDDAVDLVRIYMVGVGMQPSCKLNPYRGWVQIRDLDVNKDNPELGYVLLNASSGCDGTMVVEAATGVYTKSWGKHVNLNLGME